MKRSGSPCDICEIWDISCVLSSFMASCSSYATFDIGIGEKVFVFIECCTLASLKWDIAIWLLFSEIIIVGTSS